MGNKVGERSCASSAMVESRVSSENDGSPVRQSGMLSCDIEISFDGWSEAATVEPRDVWGDKTLRRFAGPSFVSASNWRRFPAVWNQGHAEFNSICDGRYLYYQVSKLRSGRVPSPRPHLGISRSPFVTLGRKQWRLDVWSGLYPNTAPERLSNR